MSSVTVTENNNKVSVDTTTNVVTVTSPGTVGPQGGAGTIESATATATEVAVSNVGVSGTPTAAVTLGGTASARTMAFAFGLPTGNSGAIGSIVTTGTDGIDIDSGATMNSFASTIQLGINAQTLWTYILSENVTGDALVVSDGTNTSPIALEGTITYAAVANETTVAESAGTITIGLVDNPTVSGNLIVSGNLTVSGSTTTINSTVLNVVDPIMVLQSVSGGGVLTSDTNKDVGLVMQYHTGSANKTAFLGFDDSVGKLTFIPDATISSEVASGTAGTIVANIEGAVTGAVTGNASTATALATARDIGGVSFDGTANINLPGVNTSGTQATSGNATTATTATTATNVTVADESSDTTCFPLFVTAATGGLPPRSGDNLTFNSNTGILTATGFAGPITGAVTGNASTATTATNVTAVANNSTDEDIFLTFVDGATGAQGIETDTGLTYNPSSGILTAARFSGPLTGAVTGNASTATALATSRTIGGTAFDGTANIAITTNANLTGHVTSSGNATTLGAFTVAQLSSALSDASISGNNTGDQTLPTDFVSAANGGTFSGPVTVGVNDTGHDVIFYGDTNGKKITWDASADNLILPDGVLIVLGNGNNLQIYANGGQSYLHSPSTLNVSTQTSGAAVTIGHTTSEVTIGDNLTVNGDITGDLTGNADTATTANAVADGVVSEAKLQVSNAPTNGYVLTARSAATGDMTWETLNADASGTAVAMAIALG